MLEMKSDASNKYLCCTRCSECSGIGKAEADSTIIGPKETPMLTKNTTKTITIIIYSYAFLYPYVFLLLTSNFQPWIYFSVPFISARRMH